jgi:sensor c-di-GMP phosphodiesterase-like protein
VRRRLEFACTVLAALAVMLAMPWLAWWESQRQAYAAESGLALGYAREALHRSEEMIAQSLAGIGLLSRSISQPCSADALASMRRVVLTSPHIKAIGSVQDGMLACSSMSGTPLSLGKRMLRASNGMLVYSAVGGDGRNASSIMAIERDGFAALFDSQLWLDAGSASPGISLSVLHLERRADEPVTLSTGYVDRAWTTRLGRQAEVAFADRTYLVAVVRSANSPTAGVAALPLADVAVRRDAIAWRLVPAGLVAGVAMAGALLLLARRQVSLATALRQALRDDEFFLVYQPVVELRSGRWIGAEALLRWRRATGELVGPDLFIPLAEQTGTITQLTARVVQLVEQDMRHFLAADPGFHVALNLAATDLHSTAIVDQLDAVLARGSARAANLVVEITERGILDVKAALAVIGMLRQRGIGVAIDDFGTGYAGLSYLESLQVDSLKIDRSFIEAIGTGAPTNEVVAHIIAMASAMGLTMVAEGVETAAQAAYLGARGVQRAQGWLFGKPQPLGEFMAGLAASAAGNAAGPEHAPW